MATVVYWTKLNPKKKTCNVGRIATVTAGVAPPLATLFVTSTVGTGVLRLRVLLET